MITFLFSYTAYLMLNTLNKGLLFSECTSLLVLFVLSFGEGRLKMSTLKWTGMSHAEVTIQAKH